MQKTFQIIFVSIFLIFFCLSYVCGQSQLIVLKKEKVLLRLYAGDEIILKLKGKTGIIKSYINNLSDTAIQAHQSTIPFHKIDRIYFSRKNFLNVTGGLLVTAGVGYFLLDQVNVVLVHGEKADLNDKVSIASAAMLGVGLPLLLMKKKYAPIRGRYRLIMADKESVFYRPDTRTDIEAFD